MARNDPVPALLGAIIRSVPERAGEVRRLLAGSGLTEAEIDRHLKPKVAKPDATAATVPTLAASVTRPMSPMLADRFGFAGAIHDVSVHLLGLKEMAALPRRRPFRRAFDAQAQHWAGSAPATVPPDRLSVISVRSLDDGDLAYLVWPDAGGAEPAVWEYAGQRETKFDDLAAYLRHLGGAG